VVYRPGMDQESLADRLRRLAFELWTAKQSSFDPTKAPPDGYGAGVVPLFDHELAARAAVDLAIVRAWITENDGSGIVAGRDGEASTIKAFE
jgi:hypothetical protein